jgi:hypothetical protein
MAAAAAAPETITVYARFLHAKEPVPVVVNPNVPVRNTPLWEMATAKGCILLFGGKRIYGTQTLTEAGVVRNEATIFMGWCRGPDPRLISWDVYIQSTTVTRLQRDVDPNLRAIRIAWKPNLNGDLPDLQELDGRKGEYQNLWRNYFTGKARAENSKAAATPADWNYWTDHWTTSRCIVVELSEEFTRKPPADMMAHIDAVRYNTLGINDTYYGGERRSWQRYTRKPFLFTGTTHTPDSSATDLHFPGPLKPGTWYALLLLNVGFTVLEDTVIPFKTWKSPPLRNTDCPVCMEPLGPPADTHQCCHCGHAVHDWCRTETCAMCRRK